MLSFIFLLWFALCVLEPLLTMRQIQHCHLLLFANTFCGSVFPAFVLAFLYVVMFQSDAAGFCGHVVLKGSHPGLSWDCSLCLAVLFVIHLFWCALRLIEQVVRRIQCCQLFSCANVSCRSSFCNDWFWTLISYSYLCFMIKLSFYSVATQSTLITRIVCIYNHHHQYLTVSVKYRETGH